MVRKLFVTLSCVLLCQSIWSQDFTFTHYSTRDGLVGATVYCMLQDKQGYLWFGTETGVSRFDGVHFRNFTTFEGLPDNQVLGMFEDSKGRIWMTPFNKSICYYYKGKIYNQENDPVLKKISLTTHVQSLAEDKYGNILLQQTSQLHLVKPSGEIKILSAYDSTANPFFVCVGTNANGNFDVLEHSRLLEVHTDTIIWNSNLDAPYFSYRFVAMKQPFLIWRHADKKFKIRRNGRDMKQAYYFDGVYKFSIVNDSIVSLNTPNGAKLLNVNSDQRRTFLPKEAISTVLQDNEGSMWFCSLGHGVFRLNSMHIANFQLWHKNGAILSGYALARFGSDWLVGSDMTKLFAVNKHAVKNVFNFLDLLPERITSLVIGQDSSIWIGTDGRLLKIDKNMNLKERLNESFSIKAFHKKNNQLYIACGWGGVIVDMQRCAIVDTFFRERTTTVFVHRDTIYVGTLNGLFTVKRGGQQPQDVGKRVPQLRNRIMDIKQGADSTLWIATYSGLHAYRDGRIISSITERDGLVSNFCRALDVFQNELWVGTDKGLQKIDISNPLRPQPEYLLSSELSSDIINAVRADSNNVVVATPEGVNIVDKFNISLQSSARLYLDEIVTSGRNILWNNKPIFLSHRNNNIRFQFAGISYRSTGDIRYRFRLIGLDTAWRFTRDNFLNYPTLPGGEYQLQLVAVNKFGAQSEPVIVDFTIEKTLWQKLWFQLLVIAGLALLIWLIGSWRIRNIRRKEAEKNNMLRKISELEQLALKSQMNPHFVFNSLNSIQHYVLDKDIEGANKFITGFSRLIRQTLDISARHEIGLDEEIQYLSTYLQLEQIRLEHKFTYEVWADPLLNVTECFIPPMTLQPFVENCIRHGIRFRRDNNGKVSVRFRQVEDYLECAIEDNGVGRKVAMLHKSRTPIEYQSKGISLTTDRINLLNRSLPRPILLNIYDLEETNGQSSGTRVIISYPILMYDTSNHS